MAQNKEHRSVWSLHGPLLEMTNGLSCPLNFLRCCFAFAPGPSRRESLSITRAQVPSDGRGRSTVGPPTYSKGVFSCGSVSWGQRCSEPQRGPRPMKDLHGGYVWAESPLKTSCSGTQTRQGAVSARVAACASLKPSAVSEMFHLAPRKRGEGKKTNKTTHARSTNTLEWTAKPHDSPCQLASDSTWQWHTYSAASRDTSSTSDGGNAKDTALCVSSATLRVFPREGVPHSGNIDFTDNF